LARFAAELTQIAGPRFQYFSIVVVFVFVCDVISEKRNDTKVRIDFALQQNEKEVTE